jgi:flagellar biosynthesis protein FliQ
MAKRAIEQTGLIPRSIIRTFERFKKQLFPGSEMLVIQEFRISRYQVIVSVQCLLTLIFVPLVVNILSKVFFITPLVDYIWNKYQNEIFLNMQQQNSALAELKSFEEKIYFEALLDESSVVNDLRLLDSIKLPTKNNLISSTLNLSIIPIPG